MKKELSAVLRSSLGARRSTPNSPPFPAAMECAANRHLEQIDVSSRIRISYGQEE